MVALIISITALIFNISVLIYVDIIAPSRVGRPQKVDQMKGLKKAVKKWKKEERRRIWKHQLNL